MKLYNSVGPNPHVVRMFLAEKDVELPTVEVDLMAGENRQGEHLGRNPAGQCPSLELDDGSFLSEITAICEYLEEKFPEPALIGSTAEERAETRMWTRRIDLNIVEPLANGFRFAEGLELFKSRIRVIPEAAQGLKDAAQQKLSWLDGLMDDREFVCGDRFTLADIHLYCFLSFGQTVGQPLNAENQEITRWFESVAARPSASA